MSVGSAVGRQPLRVALELEDVGEHLGHGRVQRRRNFRANSTCW